MTPALLERRLAWLRQNKYVVLDLSDAIERLTSGKLRRREIVITIDDGFHSVFALAAPLFRAYRMSATVYVTTYYVLNPHPIFRLAIQYMAWKSRRDIIELSGMITGLSGVIPLNAPRVADLLQSFYECGETQCTEEERVRIAREFGRRVGVDYDELLRSRRLNLMSGAEIKALREYGFDIQLHTHRHHLPSTHGQMSREIEDNRTALTPLTTAPLEHLCYPSGIWSTEQWPTLATLGVKTATTCMPGFNSSRTPLLGLRRFLDGQDISMDEYVAEMRGVKDLYRRIRRGAG